MPSKDGAPYRLPTRDTCREALISRPCVRGLFSDIDSWYRVSLSLLSRFRIVDCKSTTALL